MEKIRDKLDQIDKEIGRHEAAIAALRSDRADIENALSVLAKHGVDVPVTGASRPPKKAITELILDSVEKLGPSTPADVVSFLQSRYGAEAMEPNTIRPTMWRMAKDGRLKNEAGRYYVFLGIASKENGEAKASPETGGGETPSNNNPASEGAHEKGEASDLADHR